MVFVNFTLNRSITLNFYWNDLYIRKFTVKLSNLNKISNRTELYRTNLIFSRRTVPGLLRTFVSVRIDQPSMSNWISSGMGMGTCGIPTTDNIPETTEKLGYPTDNIPETPEKLGYPTDNIPDNRFFKTLNFIIFIKNKTKYV